MPRIAEPPAPALPWKDWEKQLIDSPTGALIFDQGDFGDMTLRRFQCQARKMFGHLGVSVRIRGEEVLVALNA